MAHLYAHHRYRGWFIATALLLAGLAVYGYQQGWFNSLRHGAISNQPGLYSINHFIDGDTIAVNMNGHVESVRFIGVDTPETHKPNTPVQCYGPEAAAYTKQQIGRQSVRLVADSSSTDRDRYGRLLRYIYLPDGSNMEEKLILSGHGFYYPYFPFAKAAQFAADERQAQQSYIGLWGACHPIPTDSGGYVSNPQT